MSRSRSYQLWLCLHLPRLGLELFTRSRPDGAVSQPVMLVENRQGMQLNAVARACGLYPGMSLATAQSICVDLVIVERAPERERAALERLAVWAYRFTSKVTPEPPNALLLEVSGSLRLFRGLDRLHRRVLGGIEALGYSGLAGVAPTPLAARALARSGRSPEPEQLAAEIEPDGGGEAPLRQVWCAAVERASRSALTELPLTFLDRPAKELGRLEAMGLATLGELLQLPRKPLARRFGRALPAYLDRLTGRRSDPREPITLPPVFTSTVHFLEDVANIGALVFPMQRLLGELIEWLRLHQLATDRLDWWLCHPRHGERMVRVRFATPERDRARLLHLSRLQLERDTGLEAVGSLMLQVSRLERYGGTAVSLFPTRGEHGTSAEQPATLVDLLRARLGARVCYSVRPADDHRPERAWSAMRPRPPRAGGGDADVSHPAPPPGARPLWLLASPRALAMQNGAPYWHGPLTLSHGPERIDVDWWTTDDDPPAARDYWIARHASGAHYWVFQEHDEARWFLHGIFA